MTKQQRSAAMNFGRQKIRLPGQNGEFARAAAIGLWAFVTIDAGPSEAGWIESAKTICFVAEAITQQFDEQQISCFVVEVGAVAYRATKQVTGFVYEQERVS
jgi:hypothetical protein